MLAIRGRWSFFQRTISYSRAFLQDLPARVPTLSSLILQGNFEEANSQRQNLRQLGQNIVFDPIYETAITHILESGSPDLQKFADWLALMPNASGPEDVPFPALTKVLMRAPQLYLSFLMEFTIVCSEKGYMHVAENLLYPCVRRHASAAEYDTFLEERGVNTPEDGTY